MPTAYTLRNRNSNHHVLLCWRLEASNDLVNWTCLDSRSHDRHSETQLNSLCQKGACTTWGIDQNICARKGITHGFTTFRLVQTDLNSGGSHNLTLSGIELYGVPANPDQWQLVNFV